MGFFANETHYWSLGRDPDQMASHLEHFCKLHGAFKKPPVGMGGAEEDRRGFCRLVCFYSLGLIQRRKYLFASLACYTSWLYPLGIFWNKFFFFPLVFCIHTKICYGHPVFLPPFPIHSYWPSPLFCLPLPPPSCFSSAKASSR